MTRMSPTASATLAAVARSAGVSTATVSRVLNGLENVVPATRQRVLAAATAVGYVPDPRFRLMAKARGRRGRVGTGTMGFLTHGYAVAELMAGSYYSAMFLGVEAAAAELGYPLITSTLSNPRDAYLPAFVRDFKVDGVIALTRQDPDLIQRVAALVPVVLLNCVVTDLALSTVMPDNPGSIRLLLDHLQALGHRRITFFAITDGGIGEVHHRERMAAFQRLVQQRGLDQARCAVPSHRHQSLDDTLYDYLAGWQAAGELPTALLCSADVYAISFMKAAAALRLDVPGDLSIVGIDNMTLCDYLQPPLTSISQPLADMGRAAVRLLHDRIVDSAHAGPPVTSHFSVTLVPRASTAPPRPPHRSCI